MKCVSPRRGIGICTPERVTLTFLTFSNQEQNHITHGSRDPNMSRGYHYQRSIKIYQVTSNRYLWHQMNTFNLSVNGLVTSKHHQNEEL